MTLTGQLRRQSLIYILLPAQLSQCVLPDPHWGQCYWPLATGPTVLSPWHMSRASAHVTLTPGGSDENRRYVLGGLAFSDDHDQIWEKNDTRADPVSASEEKKIG